MDAPAVAVSRDGKTIAAAWMDMRAGTNNRDVQWTIGTGGKFAPETSVNDDSAGTQGHPSLTIAPDGTVWCAWEDGRSGPNAQRIYVSDSATKKNRPLSAEGEGAGATRKLDPADAALGRCSGDPFPNRSRRGCGHAPSTKSWDSDICSVRASRCAKRSRREASVR